MTMPILRLSKISCINCGKNIWEICDCDECLEREKEYPSLRMLVCAVCEEGWFLQDLKAGLPTTDVEVNNIITHL